MLDFSHIPDSPNIDIQSFYGDVSNNLNQWKTWRKPRGCKFVYMIGVGGGSSGGCGVNTGATSGGGAGGGSGAQTSLFIPAFLLPDILYVQAGRGGTPVTSSGGIGVAGLGTYVAYEPDPGLTVNMCILNANGGNATGAAATTTTGGAAGTAASVATIGQMCLAAKGKYQFFAGQAGTAGGINGGNATALVLPTTGLMVSGGTGGGGSAASLGGGGGTIVASGINGDGVIPSTTNAGGGAFNAFPAGDGLVGFVSPYSLMNFGGSGGGGASTTAGGLAGRGGDGAPGCGGGASGGGTSTNTTLQSGAGGPGFVWIFSW